MVPNLGRRVLSVILCVKWPVLVLPWGGPLSVVSFGLRVFLEKRVLSVILCVKWSVLVLPWGGPLSVVTPRVENF